MIQRTAIRAVVLDERRDILLIQGRVPDTGEALWMTPGGGLEDGEAHSDCLLRELFEETGHQAATHERLVWTRRHQFLFNGQHYDQTEYFYLVPAPRFDPTNANNPAAHELEGFLQFRWWSLDDIAASRDTFVPGQLAHWLHQLEQDPQPHPVDVSGP